MVSFVAVLRNASGAVAAVASRLDAEARRACSPHGFDHELVLVDNGSTDGTFEEVEAWLRGATDARAIALVSSGDPEPAFLAGMEHALGDWVVLTDPAEDDPAAFSLLVAAVAQGADVALAAPPHGLSRGRAYGVASGAFVAGVRSLGGIDLRAQAGRYRAVSKRVVSFVTMHENAAVAHRALPSLGGFRTAVVRQEGPPLLEQAGRVSIRRRVDGALRLVTATSSAPLRLATVSCAAAAFLSLLYSVYVAAVFLTRHGGVAPGWTTMSLQISALFFFLSLAVALLSEYVLQLSAHTRGAPPYHLAREARSAVVSREQRLNVVGTGGPVREGQAA